MHKAACPVRYASPLIVICRWLPGQVGTSIAVAHVDRSGVRRHDCLPNSRMAPKQVVVTGANSGIGKEVSKELAAQGYHVVLACRNMDSCAAMKQQLDAMSLPGTTECCRLDLANQDSIRKFADQEQARLRKLGQPLAVLVNNAGVMGLPLEADGSDPHLTTNHLGPYLLTRLLLPAMEPGSRVVTVASRAHSWGSLQLEDRGGRPRVTGTPGNWFLQYARSKLCNVLMTAELQRLYGQQPGIIATSVSPGFVNTGIFNGLPWYAAGVAQLLAPWLGRTPAQGAATVVYAATSPDLEHPSKPPPLLLHDCKPYEASAAARDAQLAKDLWAASAAAVNWEGKD